MTRSLLLLLLALLPGAAPSSAAVDKISEDDRVLIDDEKARAAEAAAARRRAEAARIAREEAAWDPARCVKAMAPMTPRRRGRSRAPERRELDMSEVRGYIGSVIETYVRNNERVGAWTVREEESGRTRRLSQLRVSLDTVAQAPGRPGFFGAGALLRDAATSQDAVAVFIVDFRGRNWCVAESRVDKALVSTVADDPVPPAGR